jgi:hypothetical protein
MSVECPPPHLLVKGQAQGPQVTFGIDVVAFDDERLTFAWTRTAHNVGTETTVAEVRASCIPIR